VPLTRRAAVAVSTLALAAVSASGPAITTAGAAAELPDTYAAAVQAAASSTAVAHRSTIDDAKDQDWFKFTVTRTSKAAVTLGNLPGDYSLAVYDGAGRRLGLSAYGGTHFERIIVSVSPGTYYARVATQGYYAKSKPYSLRFRGLPSGVIALDQHKATHPAAHRVVATIYNNSSSWQWVGEVQYAWLDKSKRVLRRDTGGMSYDFWIIPPHGSRPFGWIGSAPPAGAVSVSVTPRATPVKAPAAVPAVTVSGVSARYVATRYNPYLRFTGTASAGSKRVSASVIGETYSTTGTLTGWGVYPVSVGAGRTERFTVDAVAPRPNAHRVYGLVGYGEPVPLQ